jgi:cob(I)alamin adenosyltransferase
MANRLSKIYTRTGDRGETGLADGSRVAKDSPRIEAIGTIDELNSCIGVLLAEAMPDELRARLSNVQNDLFDLGGELSVPGHDILSPSHVARLETALDAFNAALPPLKDFILPGGSRAAALAHVARTVCRRAERRVITLALTQGESVPALACPYLNRLSDLLFVASRVLNRWNNEKDGGDVLWQPGKSRK